MQGISHPAADGVTQIAEGTDQTGEQSTGRPRPQFHDQSDTQRPLTPHAQRTKKAQDG
jgi:hypothetical protein